jgi:superfamily II DNA helicase RecQ
VEEPASVGMQLEWGGYEGEVAAVTAEGVALRVGRATFTVAFGSLVKVAGRRRTLGPPGRTARIGSKDQPSADPDLFEALKHWRSARAKADGVPAYVVAKDVTLEAIAGRRPGSLAELATIDGIGPAKLERYGDELLAIVDEAPPRP